MLPSLLRLFVPAIAATAFATGLAAQCQSVTTAQTSTFTRSGIMFDVVNVSAEPIRITALDQMAANIGVTTVHLYTKVGTWIGSHATPANWTHVGSNSAWYHLAAPSLSPLGIPMNVVIAPGATQGFYVGVNITSTTQLLAFRGVLGQLGASQASDGTVNVRIGAVVDYPFTTTLGLTDGNGIKWLGRVHYCKAATNTVIGTGCGVNANSFYGHYPDAIAAQQALDGNVLRLAPNATGYTGTWENGTAAAAYIPPSGAIPLPVGDDSFAPLVPSTPLPTPHGAQPVLAVSGNGIVAFGSFVDTPGTNSWLPTTNGFLQSTNGGVYAWHDYNSTEPGSGAVAYHYAGDLLCVTFADVENYPMGLQNRSTLQFQFDLLTGAIAIVFVAIDGSVASPFGSGHIVGITEPGGSMDPGAVDLATASLLTTSPEGGQRLSLQGTTTPVVGAMWQLQTTDLPASMAFGIAVIGLSDPGVNDLTILGMPGCGLRASLDILVPFTVAPGAPSYDWGIVVPANAPLGLPIYATTIAAPDPATNAFGLISSNGIRGLVNGF
jgi:hypothetical protein